MRVAVTGANGFLGKALVNALHAKGYEVKALTRADYGALESFKGLLDVDCVIHTAALVHSPNAKAADYEATNVQGTFRLATSAVEQGVKRFIFISTIKVMGEGSDAPYVETQTPHPQGGYATSKLRAEMLLGALPFNLSVFRPPLIYGKGVKANFAALFKLVQKGIPLPFQSLENKRSLIYIENFCDAIIASLENPKCFGKTYHLDDGAPVSTKALIKAMRQDARLFSAPLSLLKIRPSLYNKLCGDLFVSSEAFKSDAGWRAPYTLEEGLAKRV